MIQGNAPYIVRGYQDDYKRLFYSRPEQSLLIPIHIPSGYGIVKAGTVMGKISESANRLGQYVPYVTEDPQVGEIWAGAANLVADGASSAVANIILAEAYKFAVGDHGLAVDSDGSPVDLGALVTRDVTTYTHQAVLTWTNNVTTGITVAKQGNVSIQTTTGSPYTLAAGILYSSVDTGEGENAQGADASLIIKNAVLYKGLLTGYDANSLADLSNASENGQFLVM
jgi:hypothetical protein